MDTKQYLKASRHVLGLVAYIIALPLLWGWLYRSNSRMAQRFYSCMSGHRMFRTMYSLIFAGGMAMVNMIYCTVTHDYMASTLTLAISVLLLGERVSHRLLQAIHRSRQMLYALMLIALAAGLTPHMLPFGMSVYLLIVAAVFYPSRRSVANHRSPRGIEFYRRYPALLLNVYYS